jgi:16S rRNA processing protein RimM
MWRASILTIFPEIFPGPLASSLAGKALASGIWSLDTHDIRDAAERLTNVKLYVPRERLPAPNHADEFYHADLIGLAVVDRDGRKLGTVVAVHNFGAGDLIEMRPTDGNTTQMLPFNEATVPVVDLAAGRLVVEPPAESPTSGG